MRTQKHSQRNINYLSRPISRVLSLPIRQLANRESVVISLVPTSRSGSSDLPAPLATRTTSRSLFDLAPDGVYIAFPFSWKPGGLLHHRFTFTPIRQLADRGSLLSAALSIIRRSEPPPVRRHPVLRCPDFPPRSAQRQIRVTTQPTQIVK